MPTCSIIMFRTITEVDNYAADVFSRTKLRSELTIKSFEIAELYNSVGDYDSALQYISAYLEVYPGSHAAYKVLGQVYEGLKLINKALTAYKKSIELYGKQPGLILKVCKLLLEANPNVLPSAAIYWLKQAQDCHLFDPVVHALYKLATDVKGEREMCSNIDMSESCDRKDLNETCNDGGTVAREICNESDLEVVVTKNSYNNQRDVNQEIQQLEMYIALSRSDVAYEHAVKLETIGSFWKELSWYHCLSSVLNEFKRCFPIESDSWEFHYFHVRLYLQLVKISSSQNIFGHHLLSLYDLDQALFEANKMLKKQESKLLESYVKHASSQLCLHLGIAVLLLGKKRKRNWKDCIEQVQPLLLLAVELCDDFTLEKPPDLERQIKLWINEGAFCRSQAGHVMLAMVEESCSLFLNQVHMFCVPGWRKKLYQKIFSSFANEKVSTSFFATSDVFENIPRSFPSPGVLLASDFRSAQLYSLSLHHLVWLGLQHWSAIYKRRVLGPKSPLSSFRLLCHFRCLVFEKLLWQECSLRGTNALDRLDLAAFLYASLYCAISALKRQLKKGLIGGDVPSVLPADLTDPLCSPEQSDWWCTAWQTLDERDSSKATLFQKGRDTMRVDGNHGIDVRLIILLANTFKNKAEHSGIQHCAVASYFSSDASYFKSEANELEGRAYLYWTTALQLLQRMDNGELITDCHNTMFCFEADELSRSDVSALIEEGRFFLASRLMRAEQHEEAAEAFSHLTSPFASYCEALMYKKMADVNVTLKKKYLLKAKATFLVTKDRIHAFHIHPEHPVCSEVDDFLKQVDIELDNVVNRDGASPEEMEQPRCSPELEGVALKLDEQLRINVVNALEDCASAQEKQQPRCSPTLRLGFNALNAGKDGALPEEMPVPRCSPELKDSAPTLDEQMKVLANTEGTLIHSVLKANQVFVGSVLKMLMINHRTVQDILLRISSMQSDINNLKSSTNAAQIDVLQQQISKIVEDVEKLKASDVCYKRTGLHRIDEEEEREEGGVDQPVAYEVQQAAQEEWVSDYTLSNSHCGCGIDIEPTSETEFCPQLFSQFANCSQLTLPPIRLPSIRSIFQQLPIFSPQSNFFPPPNFVPQQSFHPRSITPSAPHFPQAPNFPPWPNFPPVSNLPQGMNFGSLEDARPAPNILPMPNFPTAPTCTSASQPVVPTTRRSRPDYISKPASDTAPYNLLASTLQQVSTSIETSEKTSGRLSTLATPFVNSVENGCSSVIAQAAPAEPTTKPEGESTSDWKTSNTEAVDTICADSKARKPDPNEGSALESPKAPPCTEADQFDELNLPSTLSDKVSSSEVVIGHCSSSVATSTTSVVSTLKSTGALDLPLSENVKSGVELCRRDPITSSSDSVPASTSGDSEKMGDERVAAPECRKSNYLDDLILYLHKVRASEKAGEEVFCGKGRVFVHTQMNWKECGVGEIKILYRPIYDSYHLVWRRRSDNELVLNQVLTEYVILKPVRSDRAWCWSGVNYVERKELPSTSSVPRGQLEVMAVRFEKVALAKKFQESFRLCQEKLRLKSNSYADTLVRINSSSGLIDFTAAVLGKTELDVSTSLPPSPEPTNRDDTETPQENVPKSKKKRGGRSARAWYRRITQAVERNRGCLVPTPTNRCPEPPASKPPASKEVPRLPPNLRPPPSNAAEELDDLFKKMYMEYHVAPVLEEEFEAQIAPFHHVPGFPEELAPPDPPHQDNPPPREEFLPHVPYSHAPWKLIINEEVQRPDYSTAPLRDPRYPSHRPKPKPIPLPNSQRRTLSLGSYNVRKSQKENPRLKARFLQLFGSTSPPLSTNAPQNHFPPVKRTKVLSVKCGKEPSEKCHNKENVRTTKWKMCYR